MTDFFDHQSNDLGRDFLPSYGGYWADQNVSPEEWNDWKWQMRHRIRSLAQLEEHLVLIDAERAGVMLTGTKLAMAVTPQFFNLVHPTDPDDPIRRQVIPRIEETWENPDDMADPCGEDDHMPVPGLVHRYPDRVLFLVTDQCAAYCRYCTRSRVVSRAGEQHLNTEFEGVFEYLEEHTEVRDVLLSGGDPLLFSDEKLERILKRLRAIEHIEFIRIGSRVPIFSPQRITSQFCEMLRRYHPVWMSVHCNHPRELTLEVKQGLERLADAGVPLGNQSVLLRGVNDDPEVMKALTQKLLRCRVRPYYLYQCDLIKGSGHLRTTTKTGLDIISELRGHTTGYAVPQFVIDAPGGGGKTPINPEYILRQDDQETIIQNYEGRVFRYPEVSESTAKTKEAASRKVETCGCSATGGGSCQEQNGHRPEGGSGSFYHDGDCLPAG